MKRNIALWQLVGFFVTCILGTLLHFLYDWTGGSILAAPFSGVNESTWEHMKLLFWPMFLYAVIQSRFFQDRSDFWCIKLRGILIGSTLIPVLFYTYNGAIGRSPDWLNIAIFFVAAAAAYISETVMFRKGNVKCGSSRTAFVLLCLIAALFVIFTFITPKIGIFRDPLTGTYGI